MTARMNGAATADAASDVGIAQVIEAFDGIVRPDGGSVRFVAVEGKTLRVAYSAGVNEDCPTCVMEPDALGQMMLDMLREHAPAIESVVVDAG